MNNKTVARYGIIGAVLLILLYLLTLIGDDSRNFAEVDTSVALQQLADKNVEEAQIDDREQRVRLTLREPITVEEREGIGDPGAVPGTHHPGHFQRGQRRGSG